MPIVLITPERLHQGSGPHVKLLQDAGFDVRYPRDATFARGTCSEAEAIAELEGIHAVLAGSELLSGPIVRSSPSLRVIARCGVGYDRVDVPAATACRVAVTITPTANHECVAEHTLALMFAVAKSVVVNDRHARTGRWNLPLTFPIRGQTLGIFGLGRIGRSLAVRARALGMTVLACDVAPNLEFMRAQEIRRVDFDELLRDSDFLSIHAPRCAETIGLFDRHVLARMKPGSVLINTARGGIIVEQDLHEALVRGPLRAAALDVFEQEPPSPNNPLFQLEQVVVAPHLGSMDWLSFQNMALEAAQCIIDLQRGRWPQGAVINDELRSEWKW